MPKVSVVIPIYRVEKYIERCAKSLFEQTLDDIEYIFVDDCSDDNSVQVLEYVIGNYPNRKTQVKILHHDVNKGLPFARKTGLTVAKGDYIAHCDSDDWVDTDMYRAMYEKAIEENADVVVCDYTVHDGNEVLEIVHGCHNKDINGFRYNLLFQRDRWSLWNKLFRRTTYSKGIIYPNANLGEDMVLTNQLMFRCSNMAYISKTYYFYYYNNLSITKIRDFSKHIRNFEDMRENTDLLIGLLKREKIEHKKWIINGLQYAVTKNLYYVMHGNKKYRNLWLNTYPYFYLRYIINPYMDIKSRIKCFLALVGIYPLEKDRL